VSVDGLEMVDEMVARVLRDLIRRRHHRHRRRRCKRLRLLEDV
jgi:hypothetical protein